MDCSTLSSSEWKTRGTILHLSLFLLIFLFPQVVSLLLAAGADPNAEDEFMNVYTTAREKQKHSLEVQVSIQFTLEVL